jgi:hypothetical protein
MNIIRDRRIGRFRMSVYMINDNPDICRAVFGQAIVLDATPCLHSNDIEYVAICEAFSLVEVGDILPFYRPSIDGAYSVSWHPGLR